MKTTAWALGHMGLLAAVVGLSPGCSKDNPGAAEPDGAAASASARAAPALACPAGSHPGAEGDCKTDDPEPQASSASASAASSAAGAPPGKCPDVRNTEIVPTFDWAKEFQLEGPMTGRLRGLAGAASETRALSVQIEAELRASCAQLATELSVKGPFGGADAACQAAADALRAARAALGPRARVTLNMHPPVCAPSMDTASACARSCDTDGDGKAAEIKCDGGASAGRCAGSCDGECEMAPVGKCPGTCVGKCTTGFTGTCSGTCKGSCGGKPMKEGSCAGKCEGACEGTARGECKGGCAGACQEKGAACPGLCVGKCSVETQDARCTGQLRAVGLDAPSGSYCETRALRRAGCVGAAVNARVENASDAAAGERYASAIERHLPAILRVERQLKGRSDAIARSPKIVETGIASVTQSLAASPALAQITPCLVGYSQMVTEGATSLNGSFRAASLVSTIAQAR